MCVLPLQNDTVIGGALVSPARRWHVAGYRVDGAALSLVLMMVVVPAMGARHEAPLQDTLKSTGVAFFALAAAFLYLWRRRVPGTNAVQWHGVLLFPMTLALYALGSMVWSHAYLGGVEAIRWFLFGLIVFLGMNVWTIRRVALLAWGIHLGAVLASLWAALQFWYDWQFFAQGPNPASTFVNRNFFAEFVVCTLPFSVLLLTRVRDKTSVFLLAFSLAFNVVALMMAGTRSALIGLALLSILLPILVVRYRKGVVSSGRGMGLGLALAGVLMASVFALGSIPTANSSLTEGTHRDNAIERAVKRSISMAAADEYRTGSFSIRAQLWRATGRMIQVNPFMGVGAGAWEVHIPRYQEAGSQLETDYYAHNEFLQLLAEYGVLGGVVLAGLLAYWGWAAYRTLHISGGTEVGASEALLRALTLSSLLVFFLVSNAGFPWRMAGTGALFALSLSILAASDVRLGCLPRWCVRMGVWKEGLVVFFLCITAICSGVAIYIAQQAIECETKLIEATKIALTIAKSGYPNDPRWQPLKTQMLQLLREGIAINPHYRKLTPIAADAMAGWGDWKNALWVWESVLSSRPYVVVLLANVARAHVHEGDYAKAQEYLQRAQALQPAAPALLSLEVILLSKTGREQQAAARAKELLEKGFVDPDLVQAAYTLGIRHQDWALSIQALQAGISAWPARAMDGWMKLGNIYSSPSVHEEEKALQAYRAALAAAPLSMREKVWAAIPSAYRPRLQDSSAVR